MAEVVLRDDQSAFVADLRLAFRQGHQAVLGVASTGFGKTVTSAWIARSAAQRGNTVWFACHRKPLVRQSSLEFGRMGIHHGLIVSGEPMAPSLVQVASIETLRRRLDKLTAPSLLVVDEAHLACSRSWTEVVQWCKARGSRVLGNSGSPARLDGRPLGDLFDAMVEAPPMRWLIDHGHLSDYLIFAPPPPDGLERLPKRGGEYVTASSEALMDKPTITGDAINHYLLHASGKRAVAYCTSINHSRHVAEQFNARGVPAAHVDGNTGKGELQQIIHALADGAISVLCNVDLITTGFDLSAQVGRDVPIEAGIMLRPTASLALYLQMAGRMLRRKPQRAIILDHVGNTLCHGLPDDEREWSLDGRSKRPTDDEPQVAARQCPACFAVHRPKPSCPICGHVYIITGREVEEVAGELVALDVEAIRQQRRAAQAKARSLEDLVRVGIDRRMASPDGWAAHVAAARRMGDINELRARARDIRRAIGG